MAESDNLPPVVQQATSLYESDHEESSTRKFRSNMTRYVAWYDDHGTHDTVAQADAMEVVTFLNELDEEYAETTVAGYQQTLSQFYKFVAGGIMDVREDNPIEDVREVRSQGEPNTMKRQQTRKNILHIEPHEKEQLCDHVPNPTVRNELLIRMLWQTGMREHEIRNLRLRDVDREARTVTIYSEKTEDPRTVPYQQNVADLLSLWLEGGYRDRFKSATDSEYVFVSRKHPKLSASRVNDVVKKAAKGAGIQEEIGTDAGGKTRHKITTHTLRHSFGIQCVKNGINIRYVQEKMGHEDLETTQRYLEFVEDDATQALAEKGPGTEDVDR